MIIGIAGNINSGKDTVASMLNYIMSVGKNRAKFSEWRTKQLSYDNAFTYKITHFADIIKANLSNIFNLNIDNFNNRYFKDEVWFNPHTGKFIEEKNTENLYKITLENYLELDINNKYHIIKLRTMIQTYAEHCKTIFGKYVWINSTINNAKFINKIHGYCLIPDVRFYEEIKSIWKEDGIIIRINRPNGEIKSNHISENDLKIENYIIENDGNLSNLFYKVLNVYEKFK